MPRPAPSASDKLVAKGQAHARQDDLETLRGTGQKSQSSTLVSCAADGPSPESLTIKTSIPYAGSFGHVAARGCPRTGLSSGSSSGRRPPIGSHSVSGAQTAATAAEVRASAKAHPSVSSGHEAKPTRANSCPSRPALSRFSRSLMDSATRTRHARGPARPDPEVSAGPGSLVTSRVRSASAASGYLVCVGRPRPGRNRRRTRREGIANPDAEGARSRRRRMTS